MIFPQLKTVELFLGLAAASLEEILVVNVLCTTDATVN